MSKKETKIVTRDGEEVTLQRFKGDSLWQEVENG